MRNKLKIKYPNFGGYTPPTEPPIVVPPSPAGPQGWGKVYNGGVGITGGTGGTLHTFNESSL